LRLLRDILFVLNTVWPYLLPAIPFLIRVTCAARYRSFMSEALPEEEREPGERRRQILALSGFSFTAALGLPAYGVSANVDIAVPTYYVILSFLCYLGALNIQSYKFYRWQDQLASALADTGALCLLLSIMAMVQLLAPPMAYSVFLGVIALNVWSSNLFARLCAWSSFFNGRSLHDYSEEETAATRRDQRAKFQSLSKAQHYLSKGS
jgi:hypothetical protein